MHKGLNTPHLLLASSNPIRMIQNLNHLLNAPELAKLSAELDRNSAALFKLGQSHFDFACSLTNQQWRQKISRLYYAVYNVRRGVMLKYNGNFSTDSTDHSSVDRLPDTIANRESHIVNLKNLREDRNLADYNHLAVADDLVIAPDDAVTFATLFLADCKQFLALTGVIV